MHCNMAPTLLVSFVDVSPYKAVRNEPMRYAPGTTVEVSPLLVDPVVRQVAQEVGRTPAQVLLRWALQEALSECRGTAGEPCRHHGAVEGNRWGAPEIPRSCGGGPRRHHWVDGGQTARAPASLPLLPT